MLSVSQEGVLKRALDVGCAVGRSSFELARDFDEVVGIDYSNAFIQRCQELKMTGQSAYKLKTEGVLGEDKIATVHPDIVRSNLCVCVTVCDCVLWCIVLHRIATE